MDDVDNRLVMRIKKLIETAKLPTKAHEGDKCWDVYASDYVEIPKYEGGNYFGVPVVTISTGIAFELPIGYGLVVKDKSGLAANQHLHVMAGEIDNGYRGELKIVVANFSGYKQIIEAGQKIAQFKLERILDADIEEITELGTTERKDGGFGSTGKY
jgi:dUTP pyrophosphatase